MNYSKSNKPTPRFGAWLRQLREERGLPLRTVAAAAEMDQAHLSKVELGQRLPTAGQTSAIAKFFKIDPIQMDARRIAEKFRMQHGSTAAAAQALLILNELPPPQTTSSRRKKHRMTR
jgi:HTH-type transcriptional regulator, competence development regulator